MLNEHFIKLNQNKIMSCSQQKYQFVCDVCGIQFSRKYNLKTHLFSEHFVSTDSIVKKTAFNNHLVEIELSPEEMCTNVDYTSFLLHKLNYISNCLKTELDRLQSLKWHLNVEVVFYKEVDNELTFTNVFF